MAAMKTYCQRWLYAVCILFFLLSVNRLVGQDVYTAPPAPSALVPATLGSIPEPKSSQQDTDTKAPIQIPWMFTKLPGVDAGAPVAAPASGQAEAPPASGANQTLHLVVGRSLFITTASRLRRVYVSNPSVLDSLAASPHELVITAKATGTSSVVVWNETGESTVYTVLADADVTGLRSALAQALPVAKIDVESQEGRVFLSGVVGADGEAEAAGKLASVYSKEVVNSIIVDPRHRPQVQLKIEIAEVDRTKVNEFAFNIFSIGPNTGLGTTGQFAAPTFPTIGGGQATTATLSDVLNLFYFSTGLNLGATLKALQSKGVLEILAEPTLMTINGQPAKFLAGGEFPYPVVQPSGGGVSTVTVQFRQYGVKLEFTPFVNPDGTIRLKIMPEVSSLDYSNEVIIAGYALPALSTRKAETEVELRDGQSFGISGILDRRTTDQFSKIPGIGDIPVLGQLFRSRNQNHSVGELIIIATANIIDPLNGPVQPPAQPNWVSPPGELKNFDHGIPK